MAKFQQPKPAPPYPVEPKKTARTAKARANEAVTAGRITPDEKMAVDIKANRLIQGHANIVNPRSHAHKLKHE